MAECYGSRIFLKKMHIILNITRNMQHGPMESVAEYQYMHEYHENPQGRPGSKDQ